ncbi:MAG: 1-propanol dehydrogenase PduQ [Lactovum sp.]
MIEIRQTTRILLAELEVLKNIEMQRVFLVTDPFLLTTSVIDRLKSILVSREIKIYSEIKPDPTIEQVANGVENMKLLSPDTLIVIGGGSAIDAAKAMKYFYLKSIQESVKIQLIAIPTTSGTGSEVTSFSVIRDSKKGIKYPLFSSEILPDIALLDKGLVKTVPKKVTADTGMDVLTHSLEAYVSINANDFSDLYAEKAFCLVFNYLSICFTDPENDVAREKMHIASTLAGLAFNIAGLGINHGLSHALGAAFHVPHGRMNTILMPEIIRFNSALKEESSLDTKIAIKKYAYLASLIGIESSQEKVAVSSLIQKIEKLQETLEMPKSLTEFGLDKKNILESIENVIINALADITTSTNPRQTNRKNLEKIIKKIM